MLAWAGAIGDFLRLLGVILGFVQQAQERKIGAQLQAGVTETALAKTEVAIAQAESDAPKTKAELVSSLDAGSF